MWRLFSMLNVLSCSSFIENLQGTVSFHPKISLSLLNILQICYSFLLLLKTFASIFIQLTIYENIIREARERIVLEYFRRILGILYENWELWISLEFTIIWEKLIDENAFESNKFRLKIWRQPIRIHGYDTIEQ